MATTVEDQIAEIKRNMPETYKAIQDKSQTIGKSAYSLVRKGLRGEPNCFYAFERGRVVGTPFALPDVTNYIAGKMVQFGVAYVCIWPMASTDQTGAVNGTH